MLANTNKRLIVLWRHGIRLTFNLKPNRLSDFGSFVLDDTLCQNVYTCHIENATSDRNTRSMSGANNPLAQLPRNSNFISSRRAFLFCSMRNIAIV